MNPNRPFGYLYLFITAIWSFHIVIDFLAGNHSILILLHIFLVITNLCLVELWLQPIRRLITYLRDQIYFRHLANLRRTTYIQFRESVKAGTLEADEFEPEARRVIK